MDFSWMPYLTGFWLLPLLCLLFMAVMMLGCRGMRFGCRRGARRETAGKEQSEAMRRDLNG